MSVTSAFVSPQHGHAHLDNTRLHITQSLDELKLLQSYRHDNILQVRLQLLSVCDALFRELQCFEITQDKGRILSTLTEKTKLLTQEFMHISLLMIHTYEYLYLCDFK